MSWYTQEFPLLQRVTSRISSLADFPYTSRRGLVKGLKRKGGPGFLPGGSPTAEEEFLRTLDLAGKTVFDIGGFVGLMTYFSPAGRRAWLPTSLCPRRGQRFARTWG